MRAYSISPSTLILMLFSLALFIFLILLIRPFIPDGNGYDVAIPLTERGIFAKASPPPEIAIEMNDEQLQDLTAAYEQGFDHPDPGKNDPCERLRLLPYKKLSTWRKQFSRRGFTMGKVRDIIATGRREAYRHPEKGVTYTKIYDPNGNWIVVDFVDCIVWQVAPYNFK